MPNVREQYQALKARINNGKQENFQFKQNIDIKYFSQEAIEQLQLEQEYSDVSVFIHPKNWRQNKEEARIHNYKMIRLNDLVERWIDLKIF